MKNILLFAFSIIAFSCSAQKKQLDNPIYVFNNCVLTLPNAPETLEAQIQMVKDLGYDGFAGHHSQDNLKLFYALKKEGLKMPEIYWGADLDEKGNFIYKEEIKEVIKAAKGTGLMVALYTNAKAFDKNRTKGDKLFAKGFQELADFAAKYGTKVAVYPHVNNYCETSEHSIRLAQLVDRENFGVIYNTCHLLKVEGEEGWKDKLINALPYLYMISINGADSGNTREMGWDQLIQPLGEGTFDTYKIVKLAKDNGYKGLFGLQCYNIKQDCKEALAKSMNTWKDYQKRYTEN
ncbi:MAG: sugar phosphate isomerase/epimerase family protein [Draconibacterium sp.]|nr:sugar phosphate isomerase/epimerase family protein [Draconibacterium sp.]